MSIFHKRSKNMITPDMAEKLRRRNEDDVFWSNIDRKSTGEDSDMDAYIPGVSDPGNRRPSRVKGRRTREVKAKIPITQPLVEDLLDSSAENREPEQEQANVRKKKPKPGRQSCKQAEKQRHVRLQEETTMMSASLESLRDRSIRQLKEITLKDLRPEDKQRVANLVRELARVGEEKERAVSELHGEREQYETQLMTLVQQQEKILREREDIQDKLFQCQQLLTEYQAQILNKEERLTSEINNRPETNGYSSNRKSRSSTKSSNQRTPENRFTNQVEDDADSVTDLLLSNKDPADNIKRPYSSMIDKEIARERSLSRSSRGSAQSRSVSPLDGRPRFTYPQKLDGIGPLHEPVASSTHKSMDINAQISNNLENDSPRSSIRGSSVQMHSPRNEKLQRKIVFNEETEDLVKKYSPNQKGKELFNDPEYAGYYKKLSPSGRKRELLRQRQALLDEQDRLKQVLENQERQLKIRQYEYQKREELQKQRMEFYKEGGKFPPLKLDFESGSGKGAEFEEEGEESDKERFNQRVGQVVTERIRDMEKVEIRSRSPRDEVEIDEDIQVRSRVSAGTSPIASPRTHVAVEMSPGRHDVDTGATERPKPRLVDVATSISYRSPLQDTSNRQGNLPLCSNRQKHSPRGAKQGHGQQERAEQGTGPRTPGDKTLNVLDIVNSMEESPRGRQGDADMENRPLTFTPNKYLVQAKGNQKSPYRSAVGSSQSGTSLRKPLNDPEESIEENKILEDIFFL